MQTVDIQDAQTRLSKLVEQAVSRGDVFIIKAGKPLVKVAPLGPSEKPKKRIGFLKGRYSAPDDIKAIGRDGIAAMFERGA
jgi:prevent-host-death family protein